MTDSGMVFSSGARVFVLIGDVPTGRRIMFETVVDEVFTPSAGTNPFLVTVDGQKFTFEPMTSEWVCRESDRPLFVLPAGDTTIGAVRAAGQEQRRFRHEQREAQKAHQARIKQAQHEVDQLRAQIDRLDRDVAWALGRLRLAEHDASAADRRVAKAQRDLASAESAHERRDQLLAEVAAREADLARLKDAPGASHEGPGL